MTEDSNHSGNGHWTISGPMWWVILAIAVVAVSAFGVTVSALVPFGEYGKLFAFILACWLCTFIGMRIMDNPKMSQMIRSDKKKP